MAATNFSTFPHFPSLPAELRNQIWHDSLPIKDKPALFPYTKGCWWVRILTESDEEYDFAWEKDRSPDLLGPVEVNVPLFFVNHEARRIALAWAHEQGIKMRYCEDRHCNIFERLFDEVHDTLYVELDKVDEFNIEPSHRLSEPEHARRVVHVASYLPRIAFPVELFQSNAITLLGLIEGCTEPKVVFIIVNAPTDMKGQRRLELGSTQGRALAYSHRRCGGFELGDNKVNWDEALYRRIEETHKDQAEVFARNRACFEIRPIFAVEV